jgi:hypothetical protein
MFAACSPATRGGLMLAVKTHPKRVVKPGRIVRYKLKVYPATTKNKTGGETAVKPKASNTSSASTLNLRVVLPTGVTYIKSKTSRPSYSPEGSGRKVTKLRPIVEEDGLQLTWEDIGATLLKACKFKVKVRVDPDAARGTVLPFSAYLFESVAVGSNALPACPQPFPNVTVTVV